MEEFIRPVDEVKTSRPAPRTRIGTFVIDIFILLAFLQPLHLRSANLRNHFFWEQKAISFVVPWYVTDCMDISEDQQDCS